MATSVFPDRSLDSDDERQWTSKGGLLEIEVDHDDHRWLLTLHGEIDLSNVELLETELRIAGRSTSARVVVDLGALEFLDSSVVHALLRHADRSPGRLRLLPGSRRVQTAFRLTDTEQQLPFVGQGDATEATD